MFPFHRALPSTFEKQYSVFPVAMLATYSSDKVTELEHGGKVILPPSALDTLSRMEVQWPVLFEVTSPASSRITHTGVLEFNADEGRMYMPSWMMNSMAVEQGSLLTVKNVALKPGTFAKFEPQNVEFLDISNPRAVLENILRGFACLSEGDVIALHYNNKVYELRVVETKPQRGISIIECDLNVDFAPPVGYVESPRDVTPMSSQGSIISDGSRSIAKKGKKKKVDPWASLGSGVRVDGKTGDSSNALRRKKQRQRKLSEMSDTSKSDMGISSNQCSFRNGSNNNVSSGEDADSSDEDDDDFTYVPGHLEFIVQHPKFKAAQLPSKGKEKMDENGVTKPSFIPFQGKGMRLK
eukprot:CFRG7956T1